MKLQMLPNWCKKLGFIIFLIGASVSMYEGFMEGLTGAPSDSGQFDSVKNYLGEKAIHWFDILSILGMIIYIFSKEKVEDDYINKLRLESYQMTALLGLSVTIVLYAFSEDIKLTLDYFIILFLWTYLITFAIKKRLE
ncbi:hypothetical protein [uncultured Tenacibaculum sp.]|uniref:hypothetical protein n=1 Tax=uncultured Tenacibaculum sp. TaxID=174713 RepID=UPI002638C46E|nr:hypothetical protein [uncultured Tenacibaculum sp.]